MPGGTLFLCESSGARIIAYGSGLSQIGTNHQVAIETWDEIPAGEAGDCYFRGIDCTIEYANGFNIGIIPVVDGVDQPEQIFTGSGTGTAPLQATLTLRGARIAAKIRTIARTGAIAFQNLQAQVLPIREVP